LNDSDVENIFEIVCTLELFFESTSKPAKCPLTLNELMLLHTRIIHHFIAQSVKLFTKLNFLTSRRETHPVVWSAR